MSPTPLTLNPRIGAHGSNNTASADGFVDKIKDLAPDEKESVACVLSYLCIIMNDTKYDFKWTLDRVADCLNGFLPSKKETEKEVFSIGEVWHVINLLASEDKHCTSNNYSDKLNKFLIRAAIQSPNRYAGFGDSQRLVRISRLLECKFDPKNLSWPKKQLRDKLAKIMITCGHDNFEKFDFSDIDFSNCNLTNLNFSLTNLTNSKFINTNLSFTILRLANLKNANLQKALLHRANLFGAVLDNADLRGAIIDGVNLEQTFINRMKIQSQALVTAYFPDLKRIDIQIDKGFVTLVYTSVDHSETNKEFIGKLEKQMDVLNVDSSIVKFIFNKIINSRDLTMGERDKKIEIFLNHLEIIMAIKFSDMVADFIFFSSCWVLRKIMSGLAKHNCCYLARCMVDLANKDNALLNDLEQLKSTLKSKDLRFQIEHAEVKKLVTGNSILAFYELLQNNRLPISIRMLACYPLPDSVICSMSSDTIKYPKIEQLDLLTATNWWLFIVDRAIKITDTHRRYSPLTFVQDVGGDDGKNYIASFLNGINFAFTKHFDLTQFYSLKALHVIVKGELSSDITDENGVYNPSGAFGYDLQKYILNGTQILQRSVTEFNQCVFVLGEDNMYVGFFSSYPSERVVTNIYSDVYGMYSQEIAVAKTVEDIKRAIILFISRVETSHFFTNCNNRICCQILLNRLLTDYGFTPCILAIPNGFSHQVILEYSFNPELSDSLAILAEGQRFYARLSPPPLEIK